MIEIETHAGLARARLELPLAELRGLLVLGHGAGGGIDAPDLAAAAEAALAVGLAVARVEQPYRVAGRRSPAPARQLDQAWVAVIAALRGGGVTAAGARSGPALDAGSGTLLVGGRSSGARVACRTATQVGAAGVLCLAFPLHPPGRADDPSKSRQGELDGAGVPVLVVQGARDPFGVPAPDSGVGREVVVVAGTHSLRGKGPVRDAVTPWLSRMS